MKGLLRFFLFLGIMLTHTVCKADETPCATLYTTPETCNGAIGCSWTPATGMGSSAICTQCSDTEYSTASMTVCGSCTNPSDNNYFSYPNHASFDSANQTSGQGSCPWKCEAGYYRGGENDASCQECPTNSSNCKANGSSGLTYTTVQCETGWHPKTNASNHTITCVQCPINSSWNAQTQQCYCNIPTPPTNPAGYFWNNAKTECIKCPTPSDTAPYEGDSNYISDCAGYYSCDIDDAHLNLIKVGNKYYCGTCGFGMNAELENTTIECNCASVGANNTNSPTPSGQQCACPSGAESGSGNYENTCVCNNNKILKRGGTNNNTFSCSECSSIVTHSAFAENGNGTTTTVYTDGIGPHACVCAKGYYKQGSNQCANCPIGHTTRDIGAESSNSCKMEKTVKLCLVTNNTNRTTSDATKCMQPIPDGVDVTTWTSTNHGR